MLDRKRCSELVDCRRNSQQFWKHLRSTVRSRKTESTIIQGVTWFDYFKKLFKDDQATNDTLHNDTFNFMSEQKDGSSLNVTITNEEIINCINSLRRSCDSGIDGTCIEMFKCTSHKIAPFLNKLFNNILQTGSFPRRME